MLGVRDCQDVLVFPLAEKHFDNPVFIICDNVVLFLHINIVTTKAAFACDSADGRAGSALSPASPGSNSGGFNPN